LDRCGVRGTWRKDDESPVVSRRHHPGVRALRPTGGFQMSATETLVPAARYRQRELHAFEADGTQFVYLVPSGAIFALDKIGRNVLDYVREVNPTREDLVAFLVHQGHSLAEINAALVELEHSEAITHGDVGPQAPKVPVKRFPLQRIVLNITNQCNLAC